MAVNTGGAQETTTITAEVLATAAAIRPSPSQEPLESSTIVPTQRLLGECEDGESAVSAILGKKPDLVFLDVQMPEVDGFEVVPLNWS